MKNIPQGTKKNILKSRLQKIVNKWIYTLQPLSNWAGLTQYEAVFFVILTEFCNFNI